VNIQGGSLDINVTGAGVKGIKADGSITIDDEKASPT
jgi:hypothetical protein